MIKLTPTITGHYRARVALRVLKACADDPGGMHPAAATVKGGSEGVSPQISHQIVHACMFIT
jgi:hypothetical protein